MTDVRKTSAPGIRRTNASGWEIRYDGPRDPTTGKRNPQSVTFRGTKAEAIAKRDELRHHAANGEFVQPTRETVGEFMLRWLRDWARINASPKTCERWSQFIDHQIIPHMGKVPLKSLETNHLVALYARLKKEGAVDGGPLAPRTIHHVHRLLHQAFIHAVAWKAMRVSPTKGVKPPRVEQREIDIPTDDEVAAILKRLDGRNPMMHAIAVTALATGARRGELCALRWKDFDEKAGALDIATSLETTRDLHADQGRCLRVKSPKTSTGRRKIGIPIEAVNALKAHWTRQQEERLLSGRVRALLNDLIFAKPDGSPIDPNTLSRNWLNNTKAATGRDVNLHSLRHRHASHLIAANVDIVTVSRRLGHADASITLRVYGHLIPNMDTRAADAAGQMLARVLTT